MYNYHMLHFDGISKKFRTDFWSPPFWALRDLSFEVAKGAITGFLGANGAGKTTSIKILLRFVAPDGGKIFFDKCLGSSFKEILSNIGYVPERPYFYPHLCGEDFVYYLGRLNGIDSIELKKRINYWFERARIGHARKLKIAGYSKGMLQRLGFVSALIHDPQLLIFDEPLSGLDPVGRKELKDIMVELNQQGKTVFFSSHIVSDVEQICQKIVVLDKGRLHYDGKISALIRSNMALDYVIEVLSEQELILPELNLENRLGNRYFFVVSPSDKDTVLRRLLELPITVESVHQRRPTLEQIIYQTENK